MVGKFFISTSTLTCDGFLAKSRETLLSAIHEWLLYKGQREHGARKRKPFKTALGLISLLFTVELSNLAKDAQNLATLKLTVTEITGEGGKLRQETTQREWSRL